jgi:hypothetical protein
MDTLELTIDYESFIARQELDYILESVDRIIGETLLPDLVLEHAGGRPVGSYIAISGVRSGSVTLLLLAGAPVAIYLKNRFAKGAKKGRLAKEVEATGKLVSDALGSLIAPINRWGEQYVAKARGDGSNLRQVKAQLPSKKRPPKR